MTGFAFDIGSAQSLPWEGRDSWWHGRADYQLTRLVADTTGLLTASTPVLVRMETLRRATIYAQRFAKEGRPELGPALLARLQHPDVQLVAPSMAAELAANRAALWLRSARLAEW